MRVDELGRKGARDLAALARGARGRGARRLSVRELRRLPRLYRGIASQLARLETRGDDVGAAAAREALTLAHGVLHADRGRAARGSLARMGRLLWIDAPRTLRREWRTLVLAAALFYGLAAIAYTAVSRDLGLAYGLLEPAVVESELTQLEALNEGEAFRGNFTFGLESSPVTSGWILAHNLLVATLFFASGLIPPLFLFLLGTNALMFGTYTAVAGQYGQLGAISSILWCHGALELSALVLSGAAGMRLVRPLFAPGPWSRRHATRLAATDSGRMFAAVVPMLVLAGLIEGFVSPHAATPARVAVALGTGAMFLAWLLLAGREARPAQRGERGSSSSV